MDRREEELRKEMAVEMGKLVMRAGGDALNDDELTRIIKAAVKLGGLVALQRLEPTAA